MGCSCTKVHCKDVGVQVKGIQAYIVTNHAWIDVEEEYDPEKFMWAIKISAPNIFKPLQESTDLKTE